MNWMPKSTAMPTNITAKAIEIGLKLPTAITPKNMVIIRPEISASMIDSTIFIDLTAHQISTSTATSISAPLSAAPWVTVAKLASARATAPVMRTRMPCSGVMPSSVAALCMASVASPPATRAPKLSLGCVISTRRAWSCAPTEPISEDQLTEGAG